jgi:hypothetical protein
MPTFQLFRIKVVSAGPQMLLKFGMARTKGEVLRAAVEERPSKEFRAGQIWRIGNLERCDEDTMYFAFGRTTTSSLEQFDESTGNFSVTPVDNSPNTHVFIDFRLQVAAIAKRPSLAQPINAIARRLSQLLTESRAVRELEGTVEVEAIPDPEDFVALLQSAHQVVRFSMYFSRPNPWDVEQDLQKPLEAALSSLGGDGGVATFIGSALYGDELSKLARAAAATGNDASARLRPVKDAKLVTKRLSGSVVTLTEEDEEELAKMTPRLLTWIREQYARVRGTLMDPR